MENIHTNRQAGSVGHSNWFKARTSLNGPLSLKKSVPQEAENPQDAEDYEKDDSEWKTVSRVSGALPRPVVFILSDLVT